MKLVDFPERNIIIAKDQPEYRQMPAHYGPDREVATVCWKLNWADRLLVLLTGKVWHQIRTFSMPMQPQKLTSFKPDLLP